MPSEREVYEDEWVTGMGIIINVNWSIRFIHAPWKGLCWVGGWGWFWAIRILRIACTSWTKFGILMPSLRFAHAPWKGMLWVACGDGCWGMMLCILSASSRLCHFNHSCTLCSCPWKGGVWDWLWGWLYSTGIVSVLLCFAYEPLKGNVWGWVWGGNGDFMGAFKIHEINLFDFHELKRDI